MSLFPKQLLIIWCFFLWFSGFERSIPAFPRYTVVGSEQLGEHHMRIENATLDDDAEYQCQVGPKGSQKPIRSDARLTVLSKLSIDKSSHSNVFAAFVPGNRRR